MAKGIAIIRIVLLLLIVLFFSGCIGSDDMSYVIPSGTGTSDNTKVNKTGDTMNLSQTLTIFKNSTGSVLPVDYICGFGSCIPRYYSYTNTGNIANYFVGIRYRGNYTNPQPIQKDDSMFRIAAAGGFDTSGVSSGSAAWIDMMAAADWNTTSHPTKIEIRTTANGTIDLITRMVVHDNGTVQIDGLSGLGNDYVCVDASGKLFRSNAAC